MEAFCTVSNRAILVYYLVAGVLGLNLWWSAGLPLAGSEASTTQALKPLVSLDPASVREVRVSGVGRSVVLERAVDTRERWRAVRPAGAVVAADLVEALLDALSTLPPVEIVSRDASTAARFGLKPPRTVIVLKTVDGVEDTVFLGERNPTRTAVYAGKGAGPLYMIGLNAQYYADLILEQAGPYADG